MVMFVLLLIALVVGAVVIVSIGGIGIGLTVVGFGDVIVGIIILILMGKNRKEPEIESARTLSLFFFRDKYTALYGVNTLWREYL